MGRSISKEGVILFLICLADAVLTVVLIAMGLAEEANPLMARCLDYGYAAFFIVKMAMVVLAVAAVESYRRRNPLFARTVLRLAIWSYLVLYFVFTVAVNC